MKIVVITCVRNEAPFLLEWIAHHRAAGVSDFLIFSNDCEDGTAALLDALAPAGVTHIRHDRTDRPVQWQALREAARHAVVTSADWVMSIDCDEYLRLNNPLKTLPELIEKIGEADAIVLPWRLFGSSGKIAFEDLPTTQQFTHAAPEDCAFPPIASYFKTLYRHQAFQKPGVHRPKNRKSTSHGLPRWLDGSGKPLPEGFAMNDGQIMLWGAPIANDLVQLNHYSVRSAQSFLVKRARGLPNHTDKPIDLTYWVERNFNTVEDRSIAHMEAATNRVLAELRALPDVAELHSQGVALHKERFEALVRDAEELALYGRLVLSTGSQPPEQAVAHDLVRRYGAIHGQTRSKS